MSGDLAPLLRLKHRIATSPLAGSAAALRRGLGRVRSLRHPELGLLLQEQAFSDACLKQIIRPDWNCLDVGAHIGSVSWQLRALAPRGHLTIIEALPAKAALLRKRFPDATVHHVAVSDTTGEVSFFESLKDPGFSSLSDRSSRGKTREIRVPMRRIDDLLPEGQVLHFLKIDVEGHEYAALRGAEARLRRDRPIILFEAGAVDDPDMKDAPYEALFGFLGALGYEIRPVFHQYFGREPVGIDGFTACRRYPFTAFNFFATVPEGSPA